MKYLKTLAATSVVALSVGAADAAVMDDYYLDFGPGGSSITTSIDDPSCKWYSCGSIAGSFGADAYGTWTPTSTYEVVELDNFFNWTVGGWGVETFTVQVDLVFASPENASGGTSGSGGFGTLFGIASAGGLKWNGPAIIDFSDGSKISMFFDDVKSGGLGNSVKSGATAKGEFAAVPVPATLPLILGGMGLLGWVSRKRKAA